MVLRRAFHIDPCAQKFCGALGAFGHGMQPCGGGFDRAHRRIIAAHHELAKGLAPRQPVFAQGLDALGDDGLISRGGPKAERALHRKAFQFRGNRQQIMQGIFGRAVLRIKARHQSRQARVKGVQRGRQFTRFDQAQHRHGAVGFNLAQALHDAAHTARTSIWAHKDGKAHIAIGIDPEIARDHSRPIDHPRHRQTFGDKPSFQLGHHRLFAVRQFLHADQNRGRNPPRCLITPILRETGGVGRVKRARRQAGGEGGVGDKFGVAFPFQIRPAYGARKMRGIGLWMG